MKKYLPYALIGLLLVAVVVWYLNFSPHALLEKGLADNSLKDIGSGTKGTGTKAGGSKGSASGGSSASVSTSASAPKKISVGASVFAKQDAVKMYDTDYKVARMKKKGEFVGTVLSINNGWLSVTDTDGNIFNVTQLNTYVP
jgi:hypothetical protein